MGKRTPETFEKRQREHAKKAKAATKRKERIERKGDEENEDGEVKKDAWMDDIIIQERPTDL